MEASKKKPIMVGVIVVCVVLAGAITYMNRPKGSGIDSIKDTELLWVKCSNPDCGAEYQMGKKDYFQSLQNASAEGTGIAALTCKQCSEESIYRAEKCEKCGTVFFRRIQEVGTYPDKCTKCGYSKIEEDRKKEREGSGEE